MHLPCLAQEEKETQKEPGGYNVLVGMDTSEHSYVKVTSHTCYESTAEKERSMQAAGHFREAEKKVESKKDLNPLH